MNTSKHTFTSSKRALGGAATIAFPALTLASTALADVRTVTEPATSVAPVVDPSVIQHGSTGAEPWIFIAASFGGLAVLLGAAALALLLLGWLIAAWWRRRAARGETATVIAGETARLEGDADLRAMLDNLRVVRDAAVRQRDDLAVDAAMDTRHVLTVIRQHLSFLPGGVLAVSGHHAEGDVEAAQHDRRIARALNTLSDELTTLRREVQHNPLVDVLEELRGVAGQAADIRDMLRRRPATIWA